MDCNPLIEWANITSSSGVNIACYAPIYEEGLSHPVSAIFSFLIKAVVYLVVTIVGIVLSLVRLMTDPDLVLVHIGSGLQYVLDAIHMIAPPIAIAAIAFGVVILHATAPRAAEGDGFLAWMIPQSTHEKVRAAVFRKSGFDYHEKELVHEFSRSVIQGLLVGGIIFLISTNPIGWLVKAINAVTRIGNTSVLDGMSGHDYATNVIGQMVFMVNYPNGGDSSCQSAWESAISSGAEDVAGCGPTPTAGPLAVLMCILFVICAGALIYYMAMVAKRGSLFLLIVMWEFAALPYKLAWAMFKPDFGTDRGRRWYDTLIETVFEFLAYLAYFLLVVFLLTSGPALVVATFQNTDLHPLLTYILLSIIFIMLGNYADRLGPSDNIRGERPENWSGVFDRERIKETVLNQVIVRDEVTDKTRIDWSQLGTNLKESNAGRDVRSLMSKDNTPEALAARDKERRAQQDQMLTEAFGIGKGEDVTNFHRSLFRDPEKHLANIDNQIAALRRKVANGDLSQEEFVVKRDQLRARQEGLEKLIEAKQDEKYMTERERKRQELAMVPMHLRSELNGREYAPQWEIDKAADLKEKKVIADYIGDGVTAEQLAKWDSVDRDLEEAHEDLEALNSARGNGMTQAEYDDRRGKILGKIEALDKVKRAKNLFNTRQIVVKDLVKDPITGKLVTPDVAAHSSKAKRVGEVLNLKAADVAKWYEHDVHEKRIEDELSSLEHRRVNGFYTTEEEIKQFNEERAKLIRERKELDRIGRTITSFESDVAQYGSDDFHARKAKESTRDYAAALAFGSDYGTAKGKLDAADKAMRLANEKVKKASEEGTSGEDLDKLIRARDKARGEYMKLKDNFTEFDNIMKNETFIAVPRVDHDESDPYSNPMTYVAPVFGVDANESAETNQVLLKAQQANAGAQQAVYTRLEELTTPIEELSKILGENDATPAAIAEHAERGLVAALGLVDTLRDRGGDLSTYGDLANTVEQANSMLTEIPGGMPTEEVEKRVARASALLRSASTATVRELADFYGKKASDEAATQAINEFEAKGVSVTIPSTFELSSFDPETLSRLQGKYFRELGSYVTEAVSDDITRAVNEASRDDALVGALDKDMGTLYSSNVYGESWAGDSFDDREDESVSQQAPTQRKSTQPTSDEVLLPEPHQSATPADPSQESATKSLTHIMRDAGNGTNFATIPDATQYEAPIKTPKEDIIRIQTLNAMMSSKDLVPVLMVNRPRMNNPI